MARKTNGPKKLTREELLDELEALDHRGRVRRMIELGREARSDAATAALLRALVEGGVYERRMSLFACVGSRDSARVLLGIQDPSRSIRAMALAMAPQVCSDGELTGLVRTLPRRRGRVLLRPLARQGRHQPADALLRETRKSNGPEVAEVLGYASGKAVAAVIDEVGPSMSDADWGRVAARHPELATAALRRRADRARQLDACLVWQGKAVIRTVAAQHPDEALALLKSLLKHATLSDFDLTTLASRRPAEVAELLLSHESGGAAATTSVDFEAGASRIPPRLLVTLAQRGYYRADRAYGHGGLDRLEPKTRALLHDRVGVRWRNHEGWIDPTILQQLPRAHRDKEARRHWDLPVLATRPAQRIPYAALLGWDEARPLLEPFLGDPDSTVRAAALGAMVSSARFTPRRFADALCLVRQRKNESDGSRGAMFAALSSLPPSRWEASHLDDIDAVLREALAAGDLSPATLAAAAKWVLRLAPFHPDRAVAWIDLLARQHVHLALHAAAPYLHGPQARRIVAALVKAHGGGKNKRHHAVISQLAQAVGPALRRFDDLTDALVRVVETTPDEYTAEDGVRMLARNHRGKLEELAPRLLRKDRSWITRAPVAEHLHRRRQDLLTPFLVRRVYGGRFPTHGQKFVPSFDSGFERWTSRQQRLYARAMEEVVADDEVERFDVGGAVRTLAALPDVTSERLVQLAASGDSSDAALRDIALRSLARLDGGQGMPLLLAALEDDRARIAIYALRKALLETTPGAALSVLRAAPMKKVTVAKEVVRLAGELEGAEAFDFLRSLRADSLHRDVYVALLRAFWNHLDRPEGWAALEEAAGSTDPAVAAAVARVPSQRLSPESQDRLAKLLAGLLSHAEPRVRIDVLKRLSELPVNDESHHLLEPMLRRVSSRLPDESGVAAQAVFATYAGAEADQVARVIAAILGDRLSLNRAAKALRDRAAREPAKSQATVRAVLKVLAKDPLTAAVQVELAMTSLPAKEVATLLSKLAKRQELTFDALRSSYNPLTGWSAFGRRDADTLGEFERQLSRDPDPRLRRLALAALDSAAQLDGWSEDRLARLEAFRRDASPEVAAAAQFIFPDEPRDHTFD